MNSLLNEFEHLGLSHTTGFVPEVLCGRLSNYYTPWEDLASELPTVIADGTITNKVQSLPHLHTNHLSEEADWQRAYVVLAFLTHGYVHGGKQSIVPVVLAEPFLRVCSHLGIESVITYAALCLFNWTCGGDSGNLEGFRAQTTFTGSLDEDAFYVVPVLVERAAGRLPSELMEALIAGAKGDWSRVVQLLDICSATLKKMADILGQLQLCHPAVFYHQIRPYIGGIDITFERENHPPLQVKQVGGSAIQSALFQVLDHILGVKHQNVMLKQMRAYMPRGHRDFLQRMERLPTLAEIALGEEHETLILSKLAECRIELKKWRDKHIAIVTRYVMLPAQAAARQSDKETNVVSGTAGSSPVLFLKEVRDETMLPRG